MSDLRAYVVMLGRAESLAPAEAARLDAYARTMRTAMLALFLVALYGNLIPRHPESVPSEPVSAEVRR